MPIRETADITVTLNDKQAGQAIDDLESKIKSLKSEMIELRKANDLSGYKDAESDLKGYQKQLRNAKRDVVDLEHVLKNLNKTNLKDLISAQRKLNSQLQKMNRNHPDYKRLVNANLQLKDSIRKVRMEQSGMNGIMSRAADGMNKYFNLVTTGLAAFTGLVLAMREWMEGLTDMDDKLANVMKTTGLSKQAVRELHSEFKYLNTRTPRKELLALAEEAGRLGKKSKQDVMEFVEVGNKIQTALGDDLGDNAAESIKQVGKLVGIYKIGSKHGVGFGDSMEMIGSAINAVSANSQAQAPFLIQMMKRMGGIADQADYGADKVLGLAATLDNLGQTSEMSSTAINKVLVDMFKDSGKYARIAGMNLTDFTNLLNTDSNEAFLKLLEGLNGNNEGLGIMAEKLDSLDVDGARAVQVLASLAGNTQMIREQQKLANEEMLKATSLTDEYNIKNENMAGNLAILNQRLRSIFVNSTINKGLESVVNKFAAWAKISIKDKLEKEQIEVNKLVMKLTDLNTSEKERRNILDELKGINPEIVKGISAENIEASKLADNIERYNQSIVRKIALANLDADKQKVLSKVADNQVQKAKSQVKLNDLMLKHNMEIALSNATAEEKNKQFLAYLEEREKLQEKLNIDGKKSIDRFGVISDHRTKEQKALQLAYDLMSNIHNKEEEIQELQGDTSAIEEQINALNELLTKTEEVNQANGGDVDSQDSFALTTQNDSFFIPEEDDEDLAIDPWMTDQRLDGTKLQITNLEDAWHEYYNQMTVNQMEHDRWLLQQEEKTKQQRLRKTEAYFNLASSLTNTYGTFLQAQMNRELAAAGDNEEKKEQIRKKYAKKQQSVAVLEAIIQGALGIVKTGSNLGYPAAIPFQIAQGLQTAAQIALIKSQEFAEGGYTGSGGKYDVAGCGS
jgi:TP901 family phage tail tape measure protein